MTEMPASCVFVDGELVDPWRVGIGHGQSRRETFNIELRIPVDVVVHELAECGEVVSIEQLVEFVLTDIASSASSNDSSAALGAYLSMAQGPKRQETLRDVADRIVGRPGVLWIWYQFEAARLSESGELLIAGRCVRAP